MSTGAPGEATCGRVLLQTVMLPAVLLTTGLRAFARPLGASTPSTESTGRRADGLPTIAPTTSSVTPIGGSQAAASEMRSQSMNDFGGDDLKLFQWIIWFRKKGNRKYVDAGFDVEEGPTTEDELRGKKKQQVVVHLNAAKENKRHDDELLKKLPDWQPSDAKFVEVCVELKQRRPRDLDEADQEKVDAIQGLRKDFRDEFSGFRKDLRTEWDKQRQR